MMRVGFFVFFYLSVHAKYIFQIISPLSLPRVEDNMLETCSDLPLHSVLILFKHCLTLGPRACGVSARAYALKRLTWLAVLAVFH